jgi:hypothetical protein
MYGASLQLKQLSALVDGVPEHVEHPSEQPLSDRDLQGEPRVNDVRAQGKPLGGRQGDSADCFRAGVCPGPRSRPPARPRP